MTFGEFDLNPSSGELFKSGVRVKLQDLPFRMLVVLAGRPGEVVTREELRAALWGAEAFVDAEAGLNTAIAKLRDALGDSADTPRFIETIPKRGYRFIGQIRDHAFAIPVAPGQTKQSAVRTLTWLSVAALVMIAGGVYGVNRHDQPQPITIAVVRFHNETGDAGLDSIAGGLTDAVVVSLARDARYAIIGNSPILRTERIFEDVQKIGSALSAQYVILGQLQRGDGGLLLRAHFIRTSDQTHLWAGKVDLGSAGREQAVTIVVERGVETGLIRAATR